MNHDLLSIGIGLVGWLLAALAIHRRGSLLLMYLSMTACALAQLVQFVQYRNLARIEDVSALLDTAGGRLFGAAVLVSVILLLNMVALWRNRKWKNKQNC